MTTNAEMRHECPPDETLSVEQTSVNIEEHPQNFRKIHPLCAAAILRSLADETIFEFPCQAFEPTQEHCLGCPELRSEARPNSEENGYQRYEFRRRKRGFEMPLKANGTPETIPHGDE